MSDHLMDTHNTNDGEPSPAPQSVSTRRFSPGCLPSNRLSSEMSLSVLVAHCTRELNRYLRGELYTESYSVELIHRSTVQGDQEARACVQRCFGGIALDWILRHPYSAEACRLKSEEYYLAQVFERFWLATASHQRVEYTTPAGILHFLRVSLHGAILDTLRAYEGPCQTPFSEPGELREPSMENETSSSELWGTIQTILVDRRELRLAYLLFHCGLKPTQIVRLYPLEWSDVHEISRLRYTIIQRLLNHVDHLR
jgi:hypothetical protein